jgi:hypothetical protein
VRQAHFRYFSTLSFNVFNRKRMMIDRAAEGSVVTSVCAFFLSFRPQHASMQIYIFHVSHCGSFSVVSSVRIDHPAGILYEQSVPLLGVIVRYDAITTMTCLFVSSYSYWRARKSHIVQKNNHHTYILKIPNSNFALENLRRVNFLYKCVLFFSRLKRENLYIYYYPNFKWNK